MDETWMQMPMPGCDSWPKAYRDLVYDGPLGDEWSLGKIDTALIAQTLADHLCQSRLKIAKFSRLKIAHSAMVDG